MRAYIVRQGDHLSSLAARFGFDEEEVWNHADNRELRERRGDGSVLHPGDVIYLPEPQGRELGFTLRSHNRYRATMATNTLRIRLQSGGTEAIANEPYRVHGLAEPIEGTTDANGNVEVEIPTHVRELYLELPEREQVMALDVGHLDPAEANTGVRERLLHLGYLLPMSLVHDIGSRALSGEELDREVSDALRAFQRDQGLDETGAANAATRDALENAYAHGS